MNQPRLAGDPATEGATFRRHDDLIMDIGMHDGADTARFLAAGFRVVAVEADPRLVMDAKQRFSTEIKNQRLVIIDAAIAEEQGTARFGVADATIWSSLAPDMIQRNQTIGTTYEYIEVRTVPFRDVLAEHGVPFYLKVDIEGYDMLCVRALRECGTIPTYVSIESNVSTLDAPSEAVFDEIAELWVLGYRRFRYVSQAKAVNEVPGNRAWAGPRWHSAWTALAQAQALKAHHNFAGLGGRYSKTVPAKAYKLVRRRVRRPMPWYDLHAALVTPELG